MKKYRVSGSEITNLYSMYDYLRVRMYDMEDAPQGNYTGEQWEEIYSRVEEVERLIDKAPCAGSLVDWQTLRRIREIKEERQRIRYERSLAAGNKNAVLAFEV